MAAVTANEPAGGPSDLFEPGTLWRRVQERTSRASERGTLAPIETEEHVLPEAGIPFSVRIVSTLRAKARANDQEDGGGGNPFRPPDPELLVAGVSATHVALLNRFPVLRHHLVVATREYQEQDLPLGPADFDALARCLAEIDGLAFYNCGPESGASQRHRHLQLVPFPVGPGSEPTPIERALAPVLADPGRATLPADPVRHAAAPLPATAWQPQDPARAAEALRLAYRALAAKTGLQLRAPDRAPPHNFLATKRWAMLVPRSREAFEGISINALGYAGALLVKDQTQLATVRRQGPIAVLRAVATK